MPSVTAFLVVLLLVAGLLPGSSFLAGRPSWHGVSRSALAISSQNVQIQSQDVIVTDALKKRVDGKIGKVLSKLSSGVVTSAHVNLKLDGKRDVSKQSHENGHCVEVVCQMKGGDTVKSEIHTHRDLYASIDLASHSLCQNLKKFRQKARSHRGSPEAKIGGSVAEDEVDEDAALFDFDEASLLEN